MIVIKTGKENTQALAEPICGMQIGKDESANKKVNTNMKTHSYTLAPFIVYYVLAIMRQQANSG